VGRQPAPVVIKQLWETGEIKTGARCRGAA
jgi:hypothetical protein